MANTRRWVRFVKSLRPDLQGDADFLGLIRDGQHDEVVAYLERRCEDARLELRDFVASHPREARLSRRSTAFENRYSDVAEEMGWDEADKLASSLTESDLDEVAWFQDEVAARARELRWWRETVGAAKELAYPSIGENA